MRPGLAVALLFAPLITGCAVELGGRAGVGGRFGANSRTGSSSEAHFAWTGAVSGHSVLRPNPGSRNGIFLGGEVESRNEATVGSRWSLGANLGFARVPQQKLFAPGFEVHGDFGTRLLEGVLFPGGDMYLGATTALPIWLFPSRQLSDVNNDPWILTRALELVLSLRGRIYLDHGVDLGHDLAPRYDATFGLALRTRFVSDFM